MDRRTCERTLALDPGVTYTLEVYAYNGNNDPAFRFSEAAQILGYTVAGDTIPPSAPTAIAVRQSGAKVNEISLTANVPADWGTTYLYRNTVDSTGSASLIDSGKKLGFHDQNISYGITYFYWGRIVDTSGNISGFSPSSSHSVLVSRLVETDYDDDSISTSKMQNLSVSNAKIGNLAVTNAKINDLSAAKIITGMLTVHPTTNGASAIFVDNSGKIRIKSMTGSPGQISWENAAGVEKAFMSGDTLSNFTLFLSDPGSIFFVQATEMIIAGSIEPSEYRGQRISGAVGANSGYLRFRDSVSNTMYKIQLHL